MNDNHKVDTAMMVPEPPTLAQLERITPSIYEASISCMAKAAWYAFGQRGVLPEHPAAILGTCFHAVLAAANRGELTVASDSDRDSARGLFDKTAQTLHDQAHSLLRLKFPAASRLPYYNLQRERTALLATRIAASRPCARYEHVGATARPSRSSLQTESRLYSRDGLITGRPDQLDGESQSIVDYKSGSVGDEESDLVSDSEARQLRVYAHLVIENGIPVTKGRIVRGDGRQCELPISAAEAQSEADNARTQLRTFNSAVSSGAVFSDLASPSSENCRWCPCMPFCDAFWAAVRPEWDRNCGVHVQGGILEAETRQIQGVSLTTFNVSVLSGTISAEHLSVEQVPSEWMTLRSGDGPRPGDIIRVVHARQSGTGVLRPDKTLTAVWRLVSEGKNSRANQG